MYPGTKRPVNQSGIIKATFGIIGNARRKLNVANQLEIPLKMVIASLSDIS